MNRHPSVSMGQWHADIQALSKSCMLAFKKKMHAIDSATEKLQTFMELGAIRALLENTQKIIIKNEIVQDNEQPPAASLKSHVEVSAASEVSIHSEGVQ